MKRSLLLFLVLVFVSCSNESSNSGASKMYFSMKDLIDNQIELLSAGEYKLEKSAVLNQLKDVETFTPDSAGWNVELKLFKDADINVPSLRGVYEKVEGPGEVGSNLREVMYVPTSKIKIGVQYLKIFFVEEIDDPRKIEIKVSDSNPLFRSETILKLGMRRDGNDNLILDNYEIDGGQKMMMMDTVAYRISGEIIR